MIKCPDCGTEMEQKTTIPTGWGHNPKIIWVCPQCGRRIN